MSWDNESTNYKFVKYVNSHKEENWDLIEQFEGKGIHMSEESQNKFKFLAYEIALDCEVDLDTGEVRCWGLNDVALEDPIKV